MNNSEIALQLTLKAMEEKLLLAKPISLCESAEPFEEANQFIAKQVNEFYSSVLNHLNNL